MARVLVLTRPEASADLAFLLEEEGHQPLFWPLVEVSEVTAGLRAAAEQLGRFSAVIAMGRGPLQALLEATVGAGSREAMPRVQWLVSDEPGARVLERLGGTARVPGDGKWTSAISGLLTADDDVLVVHDAVLPEIIVDALEAAGTRVTEVVLPPTPRLEFADAGDAQVVIIHSAAEGEAWVEATRSPNAHAPDEYCCGPHAPAEAPVARQLVAPEKVRVVTASAAAAQALESLGVEVHARAAGPGADAVVDATLGLLAG